MFKEIGHFIRNGIEVMRMQKEHSRADFSDWFMTKADEQGYGDVRRELVADLRGRVLDLGCGTGAMFPYYDERAEIEAIEPEEDFLGLAIARAKKSHRNVHAERGDGMSLAFPDDTFDAVVLGLVLCSVPSVERVLSEAFRVLKKGGQLRAIEHVRSEAAISGFLMDMTNPLWMKINKQGCRWDRNPLDAMRAAGFEIDDVMSFKRFDTIMPAFPMRRVRAHKP